MDHVRGHTMCHRISSQLVSKSFSCHGLSGVRFGWMLSNPAIRECRRMSSSAKYSSRWCTTTGCSGGGCTITHFARTISADYGCSCRRRRPWRSVVWCLQFRAVRSNSGRARTCTVSGDSRSGYPRPNGSSDL